MKCFGYSGKISKNNFSHFRIPLLSFLGLFVFLFISQGWTYVITIVVAICTAIIIQTVPYFVADTGGGAIFNWEDGSNGNDIYAQRVNTGGTTLWTLNGVIISTAVNNQQNPRLCADSAGGAIITWQDQRNNATNVDIYAQR